MSRRLLITMSRLAMALVALAPFSILTLSIFAHHSTAQYKDEEVELRGTVTDFVWRNPHVLVLFNVKDESGKVVEWTAEGASVPGLLADGMTKDSLKAGDDIFITVRPSKAGVPSSLLRSCRKADGTVVLKWTRAGGGTYAERKAKGQIKE